MKTLITGLNYFLDYYKMDLWLFRIFKQSVGFGKVIKIKKGVDGLHYILNLYVIHLLKNIMPRFKIFFILLLLLVALMLIGLHLSESAEGPHGGAVKQAGDYHIEVKTVYPYFYAFLLDKSSRPISNKGISCEAKFIFADHTDINVSLGPFEEDGFSARLITQEFNSSQVYFNIHGKIVFAQFENESLIVDKK